MAKCSFSWCSCWTKGNQIQWSQNEKCQFSVDDKSYTCVLDKRCQLMKLASNNKGGWKTWTWWTCGKVMLGEMTSSKQTNCLSQSSPCSSVSEMWNLSGPELVACLAVGHPVISWTSWIHEDFIPCLGMFLITSILASINLYNHCLINKLLTKQFGFRRNHMEKGIQLLHKSICCCCC